MAYIERLNASERNTFHLPDAVKGFATMEYYLIHPLQADDANDTILGLWSPWKILAVGRRASHPFEVTMRQLNIDEEEVDIEGLTPWTDCMAGHGLTPPEFAAVRDFLLTQARQTPEPPNAQANHRYFLPASVTDYAACGIPHGALDAFASVFEKAHIYRFAPDHTIGALENASYLMISEWTCPLSSPATTASIKFETYKPARISEIQEAWREYEQGRGSYPYIDAAMLNAVNESRLTRNALLELARLLTERLQGA